MIGDDDELESDNEELDRPFEKWHDHFVIGEEPESDNDELDRPFEKWE